MKDYKNENRWTESRQFLYADDACEALLTLSKEYNKKNFR